MKIFETRPIANNYWRISSIGLFALVAFCLIPTERVFAQSNTESKLVDFIFRPTKQAGALSGCSMEFTVKFKDHLYEQGRDLALVGTLLTQALGENKGYANLLKVTLIGSETGKKAEQLPIEHIYLENENGVIRPSQTRNGENGFKLAMFFGDDVLRIAKDIRNLKVGFNLEGGITDLVTSFDFKDEGFEGAPLTSFDQCTMQMALENVKLMKK